MEGRESNVTDVPAAAIRALFGETAIERGAISTSKNQLCDNGFHRELELNERLDPTGHIIFVVSQFSSICKSALLFRKKG